MQVISPGYANGSTMPARYANTGVPGGVNVSVPLVWSEVPDRTGSFAVTMIDRHPAANKWVHWLVVDIPAGIRSLADGASGGRRLPVGATELVNTFGTLGYGGPQPPRGSGQHDYETTVYALDVDFPKMSRDSTWKDVSLAMEGHLLASASVTGRFGR